MVARSHIVIQGALNTPNQNAAKIKWSNCDNIRFVNSSTYINFLYSFLDCDLCEPGNQFHECLTP